MKTRLALLVALSLVTALATAGCRHPYYYDSHYRAPSYAASGTVTYHASTTSPVWYYTYDSSGRIVYYKTYQVDYTQSGHYYPHACTKTTTCPICYQQPSPVYSTTKPVYTSQPVYTQPTYTQPTYTSPPVYYRSYPVYTHPTNRYPRHYSPPRHSPPPRYTPPPRHDSPRHSPPPQPTTVTVTRHPKPASKTTVIELPVPPLPKIPVPKIPVPKIFPWQKKDDK